MLPEFEIHQPILFGIFLSLATIKEVSEPKQQNLISTKKFKNRIGCLQPSNSLPRAVDNLGNISKTEVLPNLSPSK